MSLSQNIIEEMDRVRRYCQIGNSIRKKNNLPTSLRLNEVQVEETGKDFLCKELLQLIADELNCWEINPFILHQAGEKWETVTENGLTLSLRLDVLPHWKAEYDKNREYRKNIREEQRAGTYNEETYKKYKNT